MDKNIGSNGGKVTALKLRKEALDRYYKNPKICKLCSKVIESVNEPPALTARRKFCNILCRKKFIILYKEKQKEKIKINPKLVKNFCSKCNCSFLSKRNKRKFCPDCWASEKTLIYIENKTKKELFSRCKNWQSARSSIIKHARKVFDKNDGQYECFKCGYNKHVEICHKKQVKDFSDDSIIKEINDFFNLIALCPTHHWEFDNGVLKI
jgi:hypothetical protein